VIENLTRRGTADAYPAPLRNAPNAALLIDFDNVTMGIRSDLQLQLKRLLNSDVFKGKISVQRAYADWRRYPQYIVPLSEASIDLIFAPAFGSNKKNATDIRLAIDALELVFTRSEIGTYILLSGDSDFSSLVLKLKEYGKYVIGVGIRESSSDLLIQNCDEYYSYNELTGLLKEGEIEHRRRDPWELVVEAVTRMQQTEDVMRSDRLKQVMQELDPDFSEKDAGFSKYSKFLQESARRGLLRLTKLDNGQYEIQLGSNANVPPELEQEKEPESEPAAEKGSQPRRRTERGGRSRRGTPAEPGMSLSHGFSLLRQALSDIGAVGEESTDVEQTRDRMRELGDEGDQLFGTRRFQRFLRQANDAGVIDLVKTEDGAHLLSLRPEAVDEGGDETARADAATTDDKATDERRPRRRGERGGRSRRGRRRRDEEAAEPESASQGKAEPAASTKESTDSDAPRKRPAAKKNPRFRRGSRGAGSSPKGGSSAGEAATASSTAEEPAVTGPVTHNRSLRGRQGRRGASAPTAPARQPESPAAGPAEPTPSAAPAVPPRRQHDDAASVPASPAPAHSTPDVSEVESGGLLKRMSAALQRAMLGEPRDEEHGDG
jgi:uncharacterized protein (TIGR00288 family)